MEAGITNGYDQVVEALTNIEQTLARGVVAGDDASGGDVEEENKDPSTPAAPPGGRRAAPTLSPVDRRIVEDLIADDVEPANNPAEAKLQADGMVSRILHQLRNRQNAESGAALRKLLIRQTLLPFSTVPVVRMRLV
jgi:hypothetical protein